MIIRIGMDATLRLGALTIRKTVELTRTPTGKFRTPEGSLELLEVIRSVQDNAIDASLTLDSGRIIAFWDTDERPCLEAVEEIMASLPAEQIGILATYAGLCQVQQDRAVEALRRDKQEQAVALADEVLGTTPYVPDVLLDAKGEAPGYTREELDKFMEERHDPTTGNDYPMP